MEGSIYMMDFEDDNTAYEDYQELLGADGQRISNSGLTVMRAVRHSPILKMKRMTVWKNFITIYLKCL